MPEDRREARGRAWSDLPILLAVVIAIGMTWPLVLHLGSDRTVDASDSLNDTWKVAWIGHALLHEPLHLFQSNTLWPNKHSLAFTDSLLGYAPAGLVAAQGPHAALVVYGLLVIFAYALAFLGAYLLAGELGAGPGAAWPPASPTPTLRGGFSHISTSAPAAGSRWRSIFWFAVTVAAGVASSPPAGWSPPGR